jgi:hypothetical protein
LKELIAKYQAIDPYLIAEIYAFRNQSDEAFQCGWAGVAGNPTQPRQSKSLSSVARVAAPGNLRDFVAQTGLRKQ